MKKVYSVLHSASHTLLAGILSSCTEYGRTILLSADGAVFQIGCVQTAVLKESDNNGKKTTSTKNEFVLFPGLNQKLFIFYLLFC